MGLHPVLQAILSIAKDSGWQFLSLFGGLFLSGLFLTWVSRWTANCFRQFLAPKLGLYLFGILGVPAHELCHAIFAKIFFHQIESIKWFDPDAKGGSYGTVMHTYSPKNLYHRVGLFFIGMGPVFLAPLFLFLLYRYLVPAALPFAAIAHQPLGLARDFTKSFFALSNWKSWSFYLFLYLSVCLTSQMELSSDDFKIARGGVLPIFLILVVINAGASIFNLNWHARWNHAFNLGLSWWSLFFGVGLLMAVVNLILCALILNLLNRLFGRDGINPFS